MSSIYKRAFKLEKHFHKMATRSRLCLNLR